MRQFQGIGNLGNVQPEVRSALINIAAAVNNLTRQNKSVGLPPELSAARGAGLTQHSGYSSGGRATVVTFGRDVDKPSRQYLLERGTGAFLYIAQDSRKLYLWNGTEYIEVPYGFDSTVQEVLCAQAIHDDFTAPTLEDATNSPYTWETQIDAAETLAIDGAPSHYLHMTCNGAAKTAIAASTYKMRFDLSEPHNLYMEVRHKSAQSDSASTWLIGFQDTALTIAPDTIITTQTNIIGFVQDGTAQKYDGICSRSAGSGTLVVANSVGDASNWTKLRIEVTSDGTARQVEFFVDDVSVGSTMDANYITLQEMRPVIGFINGGGSRNHFIDYVHANWLTRPLSS